jgi:ABC-type nitrate/sulfonate/bicarbonate transport system ATPase subunit
MNDSIVLRDVSKAFSETVVFSHLSLSIPCTGVTALMGESGCGKSTLVSMLLGLIPPDAGEILIPFSSISVAFQDPRLLPWLNARDNVSLVIKHGGRTEKRRLAEEMLRRFGIAEAWEKLPSELSGGMQQRVSLARAFLAEGNLLILDEPFRGLDEENKQNVIRLIRQESLCRKILLVTHDEQAAQALSAEILRLS